MEQHPKRSSHNNIVGGILIVLGFIFLLDVFHIMDFGNVFADWWPLILIIIGFYKLKGHDKTGGAFLFILGVIFLSATLDIINWGSIFRFWPVILILIGISLIYRGKKSPIHRWKASHETGEDIINASAIFSGLHRTVTSEKFQGGDVSALFGGIELDLRKATISSEGCNLNLTAIFGGIEVFVPPNVKVSISGTPIFGSVEDTTTPVHKEDNGAEIHCHCTAAFGGVEIRN